MFDCAAHVIIVMLLGRAQRADPGGPAGARGVSCLTLQPMSSLYCYCAQRADGGGGGVRRSPQGQGGFVTFDCAEHVDAALPSLGEQRADGEQTLCCKEQKRCAARRVSRAALWVIQA